ncbi:TolC family protein [Thauera sinica]|uniref:TolC family protein n=1 Tax=Thauera sinica TaxID=2665146 RepID=A0ABW1ATY8_9RHOO|nr:TolC family protein [Thauera sp. K11]ATE59267.1 RND transporter [Thauera sp. K11]
MNRTYRRGTGLFALCALALAGGCATVGPDYRTPDPGAAGVPEQWSASLPEGERLLELRNWWSQFGSPTMAGLIDEALETSPSMDAALARVAQARAGVGMGMAALLPKIGVTGGIGRGRSNEKTSLRGARVDTDTDTGARDVLHGQVGTFEGSLLTTRSLSTDMSWEIDLFGGRRRSLEGSRATFEARRAEWRGARVTLAAEVANVYVLRRHCEGLLAVADADLVSRTETHLLTLQKRDAGFVIPADADRTEASVAEARSVRSGLEAECTQYQNQLVALTGLPYGEIGSRLAADRASLPTPPDGALPVVPAEAISQRPDVAVSERVLAAASADIGVAKAAALPSITLIGSIGVNVGRGGKRDTTGYNGIEAQSNSGSYRVTTRSWSFGPSISLPLFDGGKAAADIAFAKAAFEEASAAYQSSVRNAVMEVENALVRVDSASSRLSDIGRAHDGYTRFFEATEAQYREGAASLLALEDARRVLLASRQAQLGERLAQLQAWITLFKAVGGGWQSAEPPAEPETFNPIPLATSAME